MKQKFRLTPQAVGAVMMAVQKGLLAAAENRPQEECDITTMLLKFELEASPSGLVVNNPPILRYDDITSDLDDEEKS